jgi:hypothetical protein
MILTRNQRRIFQYFSRSIIPNFVELIKIFIVLIQIKSIYKLVVKLVHKGKHFNHFVTRLAFQLITSEKPTWLDDLYVAPEGHVLIFNSRKQFWKLLELFEKYIPICFEFYPFKEWDLLEKGVLQLFQIFLRPILSEIYFVNFWPAFYKHMQLRLLSVKLSQINVKKVSLENVVFWVF